ncbi:SDR family oxidoreductase [Paenibacillus allorhizosphaerae]|uniref:Quinone oxidoreductase 2 n=1 Tax=Paenibacillus allorhizosphaerae TaxID=2849866 RepID=A0ABM8V9N2_9BACL|nr:SDR family oxidoreductase [Paenibacillus allorhizosphaerae]CAG7613767.1 Quinone oxidoreductase 2 [Paenibacillus allorhizosphaerae]
MSIVITGASGKLGRFIINQLLQKVSSEQIIACVRRLESGKPYEEQGIIVRHCDYDQPESLEHAFAGASRLLLISSSHHDDTIRLRQHAHVIEAAKKSKVDHLLYTSFAFPEHGSVSPVHLHLATEHAIRTTGIPFTFLRNALYTDFVGALDINEAIKKGKLSIVPGDWKFNSVTRQDLAAVCAAVLSEPGHKNKIYELTASAPWTFEDLADALSSLSGKTISLQPDPEIRNWIYGFLSKIDTTSTSSDLERLLGRPVTTLKESVKPFISL